MAMRNLRTCFAALAMIIGSGQVVAQDVRYLAEAVNEINSIYFEVGTPEDEERLQIAKIACSALSRLLDDDAAFIERTETLLKAGAEVSDEIRNYLGDLGSLNEFLSAEDQLLEEQGFSELSRALFLISIEKPDVADVELSEVNIDQLLQRIETLRSAACAAQNDALDQYRTSLIRKGVVGVAVIGADGLLSFLSGGIATLVAGASAGVGLNEILEAVEEFE